MNVIFTINRCEEHPPVMGLKLFTTVTEYVEGNRSKIPRNN
jgi:hypothetical protein